MPASFEVTIAPQDLLRRVLEGFRRSYAAAGQRQTLL
jgi:hypothetical protein